LYEGSDDALRDWVDIVRSGLVARVGENMRTLTDLSLAAVAAVALVAIGYTSAELSRGVLEAHQHWWSTAPLILLILTAGVWVWRRRQRQAVD
jgi:hypothetical protein